MQILKFGGSSVANPDRIRACARVLAHKRQTEGYRALVVCSALGGVTDALAEAGRNWPVNGDAGYRVRRPRHPRPPHPVRPRPSRPRAPMPPSKPNSRSA